MSKYSCSLPIPSFPFFFFSLFHLFSLPFSLIFLSSLSFSSSFKYPSPGCCSHQSTPGSATALPNRQRCLQLVVFLISFWVYIYFRFICNLSYTFIDRIFCIFSEVFSRLRFICDLCLVLSLIVSYFQNAKQRSQHETNGQSPGRANSKTPDNPSSSSAASKKTFITNATKLKSKPPKPLEHKPWKSNSPVAHDIYRNNYLDNEDTVLKSRWEWIVRWHMTSIGITT